MTDPTHPIKDITAQRLRDLQRLRSRLAQLPPEKSMDFIMEAPQPAALVHSLTEEDFYFLVHDVGPDDALPLLSLASDGQIEYLLDLEGWRRDRMHLPALTKWLERLMEAQPQRILPWLLREKIDFTQFFLHKTIQVLIREHDEDPSVFGDDFFTADDVFYVRVLPGRKVPADGEGEEADGAEDESHRQAFLRRLITRIANEDHVLYQRLLMNAASLLPAEAEEELYRLKNIRLAERGFLPFNEAVGVYEPLDAADLYRHPAKHFERDPAAGGLLPVPQYPVGMIEAKSVFSEALRLVDSTETLHHLQMEFAGLSNQIVAADQKLVQDRGVLRDIVRKACGYLSIGIEALNEATHPHADHDLQVQAASYICRFPLSHIFRVGYGRALRLKWKVQRWHKNAWYTAAGLPLSFWGETWLGVIGGLMIKKPLFFDNYRTEKLYREFETLAEVDATQECIGQIMAMDALLSRLNLDNRRIPGQHLTYKSLLLTLWARHHTGALGDSGAPLTTEPIGLSAFRPFFRELFGIKDADHPAASPRKSTSAMKSSFLAWLSGATGMSAGEITGFLGPSLDALFDELDAELGAVAPRHIDPRFILLFRIR
jgi:Family of unknown function (DUF6178)